MKPSLSALAFLLPLMLAQTQNKGVRPIAVSLDSASVVFASHAINEYFYRLDKNARPRFAVAVKSATSQIVKGALYRYTIVVTGGSTFEYCDVKVLVKAWMPPPKRFIGHVTSCRAAEVERNFEDVERADSNDSLVQQAVAAFVKIAPIELKLNERGFVMDTENGFIMKQKIENGVLFKFFQTVRIPSNCSSADGGGGGGGGGFNPLQCHDGYCNVEMIWNPYATVKFQLDDSLECVKR